MIGTEPCMRTLLCFYSLDQKDNSIHFVVGRDTATATYFKTNGPLPTARLVSRTVMEQTSNLSSEFSHLMMGYGQFLDHDITISPEAGGEGGVVETA